MSERLIDANALMHDIADSINQADEWAKESNENGDRHGVKCAADAHRSLLAMMSRVKEAPTIEAEPVRHGRWIEAVKHRDENGTILTDYECSECCAMVKDIGAEEIESERFCYNCGARMDGGAENG